MHTTLKDRRWWQLAENSLLNKCTNAGLTINAECATVSSTYDKPM
jgi:hypothetical protein